MLRKKTKIEIATPDEVKEYAQAQAGEAKPQEHAASAPETAKAAPEAAVAGAAATPAAAEEARKEIQALRAEAEQWKDKCLRAKAELQNYQRRSEQSRAEAIKYANAEFAKSLLGLLDDFDRLLGHAGSAVNDGDAVIHALQLMHENLVKAMKQQHVEPIQAVDQPFDPAFHQAVMEQPSDQYPEPTVLQELQKGYRMHDRLLRAAKVIVSKPAQPAGSDTRAAEADGGQAVPLSEGPGDDSTKKE